MVSTIKSLIFDIKQNNYTDNKIISLRDELSKYNVDEIKSILSNDEITDLLNICKDTYYNTQKEIIDDYKFDALETYIGLENNNYVGSKSTAKHANYTIKHSFIMGSLSKVQIKQDKETGNVDMNYFADEISKYIDKSLNTKYFETTPKLDGCSFSAEFTVDENHNYKFISCATRGDGNYGTDISHWIKPKILKEWTKIKECCQDILTPNDILCIRGEVLVPVKDFNEKYADEFTNPRSYVAGLLGRKLSDIHPDLILHNDLHFVCYDYRIYNTVSKKYTELSWINKNDPTYKILSNYIGYIGELPETKYCQLHSYSNRITGKMLSDIYDEYNKFRNNESVYALDGIVFKPSCSNRLYNDDRARPVDCVAMKFIPMINSTHIIDIEWNVKKTGEYFPKAIIEPIYLDGKELKKASLHNYNYIIKNKCGIGSEVRISLAGDIIPFVYEIVKPSGIDNINLPHDSEVITETSGNMHLMKIFKSHNEFNKNKFLASATALNINTIGPAAANTLWDGLHNDIKDLTNIVYLMSDNNLDLITKTFGETKTYTNIVNNLREYRNHLTLEDIILSFCFKTCGHRASALCAKIIRNEEYSTSSFSSVSYNWALDKNSEEYNLVMNVVNLLNIDISAKENSKDNNEKIKIIMTGSPKAFGFSTKKDFLNIHPEYEETTVWSECKILFTDDLNSTSSKMKKANKLGIEIKTYE